jgi:hypothetical protein
MEHVTPTETEGRMPARLSRGHAGRTTLLSLLGALTLALATVSTALADVPKPTVAVNPGFGVAGTSVSLTGNNFPPNDSVTVGYASGSCSSNVTAIAGATGTSDSNGGVTIIFTWPSTDTGKFSICASDSINHSTFSPDQPFNVLPKPSITISSPVYSEQPVTVTGTNFLPTSTSGDSVEILYGAAGSNGCTNSVGTATVKDDGSFSATFKAPHADAVTGITIVAVEPQGSCGQSNPGPILQAQASASISPAPSISVSSSIDSGKSVTVTGQHFLPGGSTVEVDYGLGSGADPCTTKARTVTVAQDGSFSTSFNAPSVSSDTPITVVAVEPTGQCATPRLRAAASATVKAPPKTFPWQYCLIPLLLLLLLLLLLFFLFRRRKQDEPVTIEERDRVFVSPSAAGGAGQGQSGTPAGTALIDRQIIARDRRGREVVIAEEVTTVEEEEEELR